MGRSFISQTEETATHFRRPAFRTQTRETSGLNDPETPPIVEFILPDGTALHAPTDREMLIGRKARAEDPDITIDLEDHEGREKGVSRCHAMVVVSKGKLTVQDLNSLNHTLLNGDMLMPMKRYTLRDGDILTIGRMILRIRYTEA